MTHSTTPINPELTVREMHFNLIMTRARHLLNTLSPTAVGFNSTIEDVAHNVASDHESGQTFWLDKARRTASQYAENNKTNNSEKRKESESPDYPPSFSDKNVKIVLRRIMLKAVVSAAVTHNLTLNDNRTLSVLQSCTDGNRLISTRAAISITVRAEIGDHVG